MALDLKKFIIRFTGEARDHLTQLTSGASELVASKMLDAERINTLFRAAHTLKGSARMLKLESIAELAHRIEDILDALRAGSFSPTPELGNLLQRALDVISNLIEHVEAERGALPPPDPALCAALTAAATGSLATPDHTEVTSPKTTPSVSPEETDQPRLSESVRVRVTKLDDLIKLMGELHSVQTQMCQQLNEARTLDQTLNRLAFENMQLIQQEELIKPAADWHQFTRNFADLINEQEQLLSELSDQALALRMLPLAMVFDPVARLTREFGRTVGKEVQCEVTGAAIELDRVFIERLNEVLVHLLRNAVDHGIESSAERLAVGKSPQGRIVLSARQAGAGILIEISDDGRGLDRERILAKAIAKGLIDDQRAQQVTAEQLTELICQPGFSTSAILTEISGRGVGMDVVKRTVIHELQGALTISSRPGEGTSVVLQLPPSLAVMRILLFQAGGCKFGLAAQYVAEILRIPRTGTIKVADRPAIVLRNEFIPLIPLIDLLKIQANLTFASNISVKPAVNGILLVLILHLSQAKLGLVVEQLLDERDYVIKPLPAQMRGSHLIAGMITTGTQELVSVLQAPTLLELARRIRGEALLGKERVRQKINLNRAQQILVVDDSLNTREIEKDILEAHGYRVTVAEDGLMGWQKALGERFDAVLTDVEMPELDGFGLTARLRGHPNYRTTPIIIITSRQKEEDKQRGIQVGADAYIVKGDFDQSSLVETLRNLLAGDQ